VLDITPVRATGWKAEDVFGTLLKIAMVNGIKENFIM
jgi:hypothetical protein